jgi:FKBP-type peptidyl-prolyl cis-trans isomerase FkpA
MPARPMMLPSLYRAAHCVAGAGRPPCRAASAARNIRRLLSSSSALEETEEQKAFYCIGGNIGRQLKNLKCLDASELDAVLVGIRDCVLDRPPAVQLRQYVPLGLKLMQERQRAASSRENSAQADALVAAAAAEGAVRTSSGLVICELEAGCGGAPGPTDTVRVHYEGRLVDGTVFDSSHNRGEPAEFPMDGVIKGWTEALLLMQVGGKALLTVPSDLAYGNAATGPIPASSTLIFELELLGCHQDGGARAMKSLGET